MRPTWEYMVKLCLKKQKKEEEGRKKKKGIISYNLEKLFTNFPFLLKKILIHITFTYTLNNWISTKKYERNEMKAMRSVGFLKESEVTLFI